MNLNWSKEQPKLPYKGEEKVGFTLTFIPPLNSILMFGGSHNKSNEVHLYNLQNKSWTVQKTYFPKKMSRKHHTAYYEKSIRALIVFGGQAQKGRSLDDLDALFIDQWKWRKMALKTTPPPRQYHTMTKLQSGNYLIFGGITLPYGNFLNDLWVIRGISAVKNFQTLEVSGCIAAQVKTKGNIPSGRHSHQSYCNGDYFYINGGQSEIYEQNFTLYSLNIKSLRWTKHSFNITVPQIKGFFQIEYFSNNGNTLFVFGGIQISNKKINRQILSLDLTNHSPRLKNISKLPKQISLEVLQNICQLPFPQLCGMSCHFYQQSKMIMLNISVQEQIHQLSIEDYLKQIKSQQILSQQLMKKSENLQVLYRQMQSYISSLYSEYQQCLNDSNYDFDGQNFEQKVQNIEMEKSNQIEECIKLKNTYLKIDKTYQDNLLMLRNARNQLAALNQNFQGCMETQRDQDL